MTSEPAAWPLSEIAARQINRFRRAAELTREQLADACKAVGGPDSLSASAIANIETGRPDATGRRRRDLTVEELVIFGRALGVPPLLLLFPFDRYREVEMLPGAIAPAWEAAEWFAGRAPFPHWQSRDDMGEVIAEVGDPADLEAFEQGAVAFELWETHQEQVKGWRQRTWEARLAREQAAHADGGAQREELLKNARAAELAADSIANALWETRRRMRQHGILAPELPEKLQHIDTDRSPLEQAIARAYTEPARPWATDGEEEGR